MKIIPRGTRMFRGGTCRSGNAFYTLDARVARMYGSVCTYVTKRALRLFEINHTSLKNVFKYLSDDTRLLMKFIFGTGLTSKNQSVTLKRLFGISAAKGGQSLGQRISFSEIDAIAMRSFAREFLTRHGYDGAYMPEKKTRFHRGIKFHSELFVTKYGVLRPTKKSSSSPPLPSSRGISKSTSAPIPLTELFIKYTKNTKRLLRPYSSQFVMYLSGGMAVKLYLRARGIRTAKTSDFDFKFAVPKSIRTQKRIDQLSESMRRVMYRHVAGFVRFLNRNGIRAHLDTRELAGVPLNKPGGKDEKKVYKVYNYSIILPSGKRHELVDASLVVVPGITRRHISLKWSRYFGMPIQTLTRLWKDTLYILAGSFVIDSIKLRNPIDGNKKEKGIKNAIRTGHLSYLKSRDRRVSHLLDLSRKLVQNVIHRNKESGTLHSEKIMKELKRRRL